MNSEYWPDVKPFLKERNQKYREENYEKRREYYGD